MAIKSNARRYLEFMEWFEKHKPDLHARYWAGISIPATGQAIEVNRQALDRGERTLVRQVIKEYYFCNKHLVLITSIKK